MNKETKELDMVEEANKFWKPHINIAFFHFKQDGCSCGKGKKCKTPGNHPITWQGHPMKPIYNRIRINTYVELDDFIYDYDVAIYPALSEILVLKFDRDADISCLDNTDETPEFINEEDCFLIYKHPADISVKSGMIQVYGYDVEVIYEDVVKLTPSSEWINPIENKIQELPSEILALIQE